MKSSDIALEPGDRILVTKDGLKREGVLMPSKTCNIVIKLDNGYNLGIKKDGCIVELVKKRIPLKVSSPPLKMREDLPTVSILSTGGTIASKVDYQTGAVSSQFSPEEIIASIPELETIANYEGKVIYNIYSENMNSDVWKGLAREVASEVRKGAQGVVIMHGTDTIMYTAAALSFMVRTPLPVVIVGSQRSSDRPSSDASMNAICAATVAVSDIAEVCLVMHGTTSDDYCSIHRGTRVRKMHTSRRDAFQSINQPPIGCVDYLSRKIRTFIPYQHRDEVELVLADQMESRCALVKYTPGASPEILDYYVDNGYKGVVLEGTGLGHVASDWIASIKRATDAGIPVVVTSQCLRGRICDRVYDTGRYMLEAGAIEGEDMLPEVALVKLMWLLANRSDEVHSLVGKPLAGEISFSTPITA
jgi:glutamyl-tRNA(Gln) amidotransferase subunit D